jgi:hypothetical protein
MDNPRGWVSSKYLALERGLTQFYSVWLGFGSFTLGIGPCKEFRRRDGFCLVRRYLHRAALLLHWLISAGKANNFLRELCLVTAASDNWKRQCASTVDVDSVKPSRFRKLRFTKQDLSTTVFQFEIVKLWTKDQL